ncbi:unnamed protein product [Fructobacillus cardui]|uniref:Uncharacterized protein n=1 Tax=Fructobacillus cardui TaxID=2893170 RepID=A0ABM9MPH3_9LACO|nr:hypothetical protein FEFB_01950 [Fructobacillus sp. EFB-N1]CAK1229996.1 unnamed protein product [Fructobacillus cardui]CAK1232758.1 unnamed protein product [Fructobacillus cardui]CAK1236792.1 unnamed protein product [Fructobacillus cardui]CAK1238185.1 unnamed protein product [Fructobacillus cardui]
MVEVVWQTFLPVTYQTLQAPFFSKNSFPLMENCFFI